MNTKDWLDEETSGGCYGDLAEVNKDWLDRVVRVIRRYREAVRKAMTYECGCTGGEEHDDLCIFGEAQKEE